MIKSEEKAKRILEEHGWKVLKLHAPDFLVYTEANPPSFCFVEVKRNVDKLSSSQKQCETFSVLQKLGFPVITFYVERGYCSLPEQMQNLYVISKRTVPRKVPFILAPLKGNLLADADLIQNEG